MNLTESKRAGKRFLATFDDGTKIHFGSKGAKTFIDHGDPIKRENYLARHAASGKEDWTNPRSAGALSRWILWGPHRHISSNYAFFKNMFRL